MRSRGRSVRIDCADSWTAKGSLPMSNARNLITGISVRPGRARPAAASIVAHGSPQLTFNSTVPTNLVLI
jgi:hypothetical protein